MNLYAWTCSSPPAGKPGTIYTDTQNPTSASTIYNSNGEDITSTFVYSQGEDSGGFYPVTSSSLTWVMSYSDAPGGDDPIIIL